MAKNTTRDSCPHDPEETAEQLYLKHLDEQSSLKFRAHIQSCRACHGIYEGTVVYIESIRQACVMLAGCTGAASG